MLKWLDLIKRANQGNPAPDRRVEKTNEEWLELLTPEQYRITRLKGTERAHTSALCELFKPGRYTCVCCDTLLFDSATKFDSGTGWPSFTQPVQENAVAYHKDNSHSMYRIETTCNTCDAHLGHVFQDGPGPEGLRFCINGVALKKQDTNERQLILGGGCFWCTEAIFQQLEGIISVESGYSGGKVMNPTYREVCSGMTDHAEVIRITYNPEVISPEDLLRIHLTTHDPTTLNRQGADRGTQYRSIIFYRNEEEKAVAQKVIREVQGAFEDKIVTQLAAFEAFYPAEAYHQDYYLSNPDRAYCRAVIDPKLRKFRELYGNKVKVDGGPSAGR